MADLTDDHTIAQSKAFMGMTDEPGWGKFATAAYRIAMKNEIIPAESKKLSNMQKLAMFSTLSKVSDQPYQCQRTKPYAVRRLHGGNPRTRH